MTPNMQSNVLSSKAMLVALNISQWSARKYDRKVSKEVAEQHHAGDAGRYNKLLIAHAAIKEVAKAAGDARLYHYEQTLPWTDEGYRILPAENYLHYTEGMRKLKARFEKSVRKFLDNYEGLKDEARLRLNTLFNEADYPHENEIMYRYAFRTNITPLPSAADFRVDLQADELDIIKADIEQRMQNAQADAMKDLYCRVKDCLDRMVERLSDPDAIFRNSLIGNLSDLCNLLPRMNMTNDETLEDMRRQIEAKLVQHDPETLRENKFLRKTVANDAKAILDSMDFYFGS